MRRNMFGEAQPEPGDDLHAAFEEDTDGGAAGLECEAESFEDAEHLGGWCCSVRNADGEELTVRGFATREALTEYLTDHGVDLLA